MNADERDGVLRACGEEDIALIDLVDRLLCGGVVIAGEITLAVADVDLVRVSLRALIASVGALESRPEPDAHLRIAAGAP